MHLSQAIVELLDAGWSEPRIAAAVGTSQSTVNRIKHGLHTKGPGFEVGNAILRLHSAQLERSSARMS